MITVDRIVSLLDYDKNTGIFRWRKRHGRIAGSINGDGYVSIQIDGAAYQAHRLAFAYVFNKWPSKFIDHIDACRTNNRIENLREATRSQNSANRGSQRDNTSGHKGVHWVNRDQRWRAEITQDGKRTYIGQFKNRDDAALAYVEVGRRIFGDYFKS